ncbi:hypothetical protein Tco_0139998 [Tanacetum coccineum]
MRRTLDILLAFTVYEEQVNGTLPKSNKEKEKTKRLSKKEGTKEKEGRKGTKEERRKKEKEGLEKIELRKAKMTIRTLLQQAPSEDEKSNGSGHRAPQLFHRRNHMSNRRNITINKNRGYGTFNFYMDELCGGKISISIQWDHREASSKENLGSPVNSSWNVKIPSLGRNTHTAKQIKVAIHPEYLEQTIAIGSTLTEDGRKELCYLVGRNLNIFPWKPADMAGVPRHIAEHRLNVHEGCPPVRQKKRSQAPKGTRQYKKKWKNLLKPAS